MRSIILFGVFLLITNSILSAQDRFVAGEMKVGNDKYDVNFSEMFPSIYVANVSKNITNIPSVRKGLLPRDIREGDMIVNTDSEKEIIYKILRNRLKVLKNNRDRISVDYVFSPNGKVIHLSFRMPNTTLLTPQEIAKIDRCLRQEIKATFKGEEYKSFPAIFYNARRAIIF